MSVTCQKCGTVDTGTYCSGCGVVLPTEDRRTWLLFVDSFLRIGDRWRDVRTFARMLASPTRNTLALFESGDAAAAFKFLQLSVFVYTLAVITPFFAGGVLVSQLAIPLMLVVTMSTFLAILYRLARRKSPLARSGHDFLVLSAYSVGFTLPIAGALQAFQLAVARTKPLLSVVPVLVAVIPLGIYSLRVWAAFWGLSKPSVFRSMLITSAINLFIAVPAGVSFALLVKPAHNSPLSVPLPAVPEVDRRALAEAEAQLLVFEQLGAWSEQFNRVRLLLGERRFPDVNAEVVAIGASGRDVRTRFASVPRDISDGQRIYDLLVETGDLAVAWADVVRDDPPPFTLEDQRQGKDRRLTDTITRFVESLNRTNRAAGFPEVPAPA